MNRRTARILFLSLLAGLALSCAPLLAPAAPTPIPGLVNTIIAATANAAATQTAALAPTATSTATSTPLPTRTPTITPTPTETFVFILYTYTPTITNTPNVTATRPYLEEWPDWQTGTVVTMPKGSGENIGTTKYFSTLHNVEVVVTRANGVKLRNVPSKMYDNGHVPAGTHLILTGYWNKNNDFGWMFVKVTLSNGAQYWVGGDTNSDKDPRNCLEFVPPPPTPTPPTPEP